MTDPHQNDVQHTPPSPASTESAASSAENNSAIAHTLDSENPLSRPFVNLDMADKVGESVESLVTGLREKTILPAEKVIRGLSLSIALTLVTLSILPMICIGLIRVLTYYVGEEQVWAAYWGTGAVFLATGGFLWTIRNRKKTAA